MRVLSTSSSAGILAGLMSFFVFGAASSVYALVPTSTTVPLTAWEQAARINAIATGNHGVGAVFTRPQANSFKPYIQRDYRTQYQLSSLSERRAISERVGNQAGARYAAERGWKRVLGSTGRSIPQGPDSAYWDATAAKLRAIERKGGASRPGFNYFSRQGTNQYHIRAAMRAIRSDKVPFAEKVANARIIKAAQQGRLESTVIRGGYSGTPTAPALDAPWDRTLVRREALEIEKRLVRRNPKLRSVFRSAEAANRAEILKHRLGQGFAALGLVGSGMMAWDAYGQSSRAWEMWNDSGLSGSAVPYLQSGFAAARWVEAGTLGLGSATQLGLLGQGSLKVFGQAAGQWFLPAAIVAEALGAGVAIYEYRLDRISDQQFTRQMTGTGIFVVCTGGGAAIGVWFGGVGALPGATVGAVVGGIGEGAAHLYWYFVDREFDAAQQEAKTSAIYKHYGVAR